MKNLYLLLFTLLTFALSQAQIVNIPDANFKNTLVNTNCVDIDGNGSGDIDADTNDDGEIQVTEALAVVGLDVTSRSIVSLEGIQSFINLISLDISSNPIGTINLNNLENLRELLIANVPLETLDLSENLNLEILYCTNNQFSSIDLSNNINLNYLECTDNQITSLDVSQNPNLIRLYFSNNNLTNLDVSQNPALEYLRISNNDITNLDFSQNSNLTYLYVIGNNLESLNMKNGNNENVFQCVTSENPNLLCMEVDDVQIPNNQNGWYQDPWTEYSLDCELGIVENNLDLMINVYPNPVKDILRIDTMNSLEINSVKIYDTLGRLLLTSKDNLDQLDISFLNSGVLLIELETTVGNLTQILIKE